MGVPPDHPLAFPTAQLLKREERRAALRVPRGPGMRQVVPAKGEDAGAFQRRIPCFRRDLLHWLAFVSEHALGMLPHLPPQHIERDLVEWHRNRLPGLGLIRVNPRLLALQIDLLPGQTCHVRGPKARRQSERRHVSQMLRQLLQQRPCLSATVCLTFLAMLSMISNMSKSTHTLATFISEARLKADLTLRAVEKETGISNAYLSQLEHGKIQTPAPQNLHKLAVLYRVPYEILMELAGYPVPKPTNTAAQPARDTMAARMGNVTKEEEEALVEYLQFLRLRKRGR